VVIRIIQDRVLQHVLHLPGYTSQVVASLPSPASCALHKRYVWMGCDILQVYLHYVWSFLEIPLCQFYQDIIQHFLLPGIK